ncbi:MAG: hypothetical protein ACD_28C00331G0002 [uncultured bacterium]|nr:MAG: hypothetical protein ACD_28C00331G0002 [uncultured bacterium]
MLNFKNILGGAWLLFVLGWYLNTHHAYVSSVMHFGKLAMVFAVVFSMGALVGVFQRKGKQGGITLNPLHALIYGSAAVVLIGTLIYAMMDASVFTAKSQLIFYGEDQVAMVDEGVPLEEGIVPAIKRGSITTDWSVGKIALPPEIQVLFAQTSLPTFAGHLALNMVKIGLFWVCITLFFYGLGAMFMKPRFLSAISGLRFFESIGIGMGLSMLVLFVVGLFDGFTSSIVRPIAALLFIAALFHAKPLLFTVKKIRWTLSVSQAWKALPFVVLGTIIFALNTIEMMVPVPTGFDALHLYQNIPNLLIQYQGLISGVNAYNFELLTTLVRLVFEAPMVVLNLTSWAGLLTLGFCFYLFRRGFSTGKAGLLVLFFMSLPMLSFMLHVDLKVDLILLFFLLLAGYEALQSIENTSSDERKSYLLKAGLFLGIAMGIKYTTVFFVLVLFAFYAFREWKAWGAVSILALGLAVLGFMDGLTFLESFSTQVVFGIATFCAVIGMAAGGVALYRHPRSFQKCKPFFMIGGIALMVFSPWLIRNAVLSPTWSMESLLQGPSSKIHLDESDVDLPEKTCSSALDYNEWDRYSGNFKGHSFWTPGVFLWESTINSGLPNNRLTDISFLFLGLALLLILHWPELKKRDPKLAQVALWTFVYTAIWLGIAKGVVWYGFPMLVGWLWLYGRLMEKEKWLIGVLGLWLLMSVSLRFSDTVNDAAALLHAGGVTDAELYQEQRVEGVLEMATILNQQEALNKNVYLAGGTFLTYYIQQNDHRVVDDQILDTFHCLFEAEDEEQTLARLKQNGFGYFLLSRQSLGAEPNLDGPLHQQFAWAQSFAESHLKPMVIRNGAVLYKIE